MNESPRVLDYGRTHGASMHLSADQTVFDAEVVPSMGPLRTQMIVGGILGYAPFMALYVYTRSTNTLLLLIGVTIFFAVLLGVLYAISRADRTTTRIHADREYLSMEEVTTATHLNRRWERGEIRRVHAQWLGFDEKARWGVLLDLPLIQQRVVGGLAEGEARSIAEGIRTALNLPESDIPFQPEAQAVPSELPNVDVAIRHGAKVDRSPFRLTIMAFGALIELDRYTLYVDCPDPVREQDSFRRRRSWRRDEITSIKGDLYHMGVTVRIAGKEMVEFLNQAPEELRIWVGRTLSNELQTTRDEQR